MTELTLNLPRYPSYKDSGVEWIGEIPAGWEVKRLKYIANLQSGETISPEQFTEDGFPVYGGNGFRGFTNTFTNEGHFALIGRQGALCGNINYATGKFFASEHAIVVYPFGNNNVLWLGEILRLANLNRFSQSAAQPGIAVNTIKHILLPYPPIQEQLAIATFLDQKTSQIEQAIGLKQQQISLLQEHKQILIQNAVTQGLNPNAPMRDSGVEWIGEIPAHWEICANRILFQERREQGREELPLLSVSIHSAVSSNEIDEEENIRGRIKIEDKSKYCLVKPNDIVFNMMRAWQGAIGAVSVDGMVSPAYIVAKPQSHINAKYFEYQYRCPIFIQQMDRHSKGITDFRKRLYWDEFKQLNTVVPSIAEQDQIVAHITTQSQKIDTAIDLLQQQIERLKEYKTTLINSVVTGKVNVTGAKNHE